MEYLLPKLKERKEIDFYKWKANIGINYVASNPVIQEKEKKMKSNIN